MARRAGRQRNQLPTCYYEGYLEKRSFKDKTSRKLWTCLCGNSLFFFNDKRDTDYVEKLDLHRFISITDDTSQDRNLDAARINLHMKDENIKLTAPHAEARELWKGFIYSVAQLCVPTSLNLLPGQLHMLNEAVEMEKERLKPPPDPTEDNYSNYISVQADMPSCYYKVSRLEAELLLERESPCGNLLLRPGRDGKSFAVTTRQDHDGPVIKHYRVARRPEGGFKIDLEMPVLCATLHDVISYLVENTGGVLKPLIIEDTYEKNLLFIHPDKENGEMSVQEAPLNVLPLSLPPKPVARRLQTPEPVLVQGNYYDIAEDSKTDTDSTAASLTQKEKHPPKVAIMPPAVGPRKFAPTTSPQNTNSSVSAEPRTRDKTGPLGQIPAAALTELKRKLEAKKLEEVPAQ
ncbi:signal-transducing adaptor protein 1-like isoform X2 [Betta splendens]|uniref:Signal-transducing adaptor protein 1-like isoform X2 n=1 Tax=Betta splendens TaxID=158456 RepID=A0A6P7MAL2_BETSP|nr:signal-transducing adaptor protein 1-like isoform X2 [Betta splendens]